MSWGLFRSRLRASGRSRWALLLVVALAAFPRVASAQSPPDPHEQGREIYNFRCYYCHGYSGDARTLAASFLATPPRNFATTSPSELSREQMIAAVTGGVDGTPMVAFSRVLEPREVELVVDFIRREFMRDKALNTVYHTPENGWPNHERYRAAFPFALGTIALDAPVGNLSEVQLAGRRFYLAYCVTCHDRGRAESDEAIWRAQSVSYPRPGYEPGDALEKDVDGVSGATTYAIHDRRPQLTTQSPRVLLGEELFQDNCAFCHAADGTGKNWIGSFLDPRPRDFTDSGFMGRMTAAGLRERVREGIPNSSMPAWKHVLSDGDIDAVIAYIAAVFHPVPGVESAIFSRN